MAPMAHGDIDREVGPIRVPVVEQKVCRAELRVAGPVVPSGETLLVGVGLSAVEEGVCQNPDHLGMPGGEVVVGAAHKVVAKGVGRSAAGRAVGGCVGQRQSQPPPHR